MARQIIRSSRRVKLLESRMNTWIRGLNTLVSSTQIKSNELSEAIDIQLVEDGKIQCPRDGQSYFGTSSGTKVTGLFPFYKSDGTRKLLRMCGTTLQVFNSNTNGWDDVSGFTYTTTLNAEAVMAYDNLYLVNGTDVLTKYNGTSITSFTEISAPTVPTVTRTGSAGSYTYSYKITAVTAVGETTPSPAGSTTLNQSTLDSSNYMTVTWSTVTNATGYNVYGRKDGKWYFIIYIEGNSSTTYVDKGAVTPQEAFTPPEGNTTGGPKGKYIALYKDSLFIFGDPSNPSRLYYSAGGDLLTDFTVGSGGGFIDVSKNDGQVGTAMVPFKDSLLVFKRGSLYRFNFTTSGLPQLQLESATIGAVNQRAVAVVENDVFAVSDRGLFSVGNEAGFAFDVIRTNELSAKARSVFQTIATNRITDVTLHYATSNNANLVILCYSPSGSTYNNKAIVYDRERLAFYKWTNIQANCWATYKDSNGTEYVLYGDDNSGYVKQVLSGSTDFGSVISGSFKLRAEDFGLQSNYKKIKNLDLVLRKPTGSISLNIIKDGVDTVRTIPLTTVSPSINFGHYTFVDFLLGESYGTGVSSQDENILRTIKNINIKGRSFLLYFSNTGSGSFTLLYAGMTAKPKSPNYRESTDIVTI